MRFHQAIARLPGQDYADGLTTAGRGRARYEVMLAQHADYVAALREAGLQVEVLDPLERHPDACFVEDVAVVTAELAVLTRPGAPSRRGEVDGIEAALRVHRPLRRIEAPGTLDGGDVLAVEDHFFIGLSERTNRDGARQLGAILAEQGLGWSTVRVGDGLHLKSSVSHVGGRTLLLSAALDREPAFRDHERQVVEPTEEYACNTLRVNDHLLLPRGFPRTRDLLGGLGVTVIELEMSEARKMDGGLSCLSLRF